MNINFVLRPAHAEVHRLDAPQEEEALEGRERRASRRSLRLVVSVMLIVTVVFAITIIVSCSCRSIIMIVSMIILRRERHALRRH